MVSTKIIVIATSAIVFAAHPSVAGGDLMDPEATARFTRMSDFIEGQEVYAFRATVTGPTRLS